MLALRLLLIVLGALLIIGVYFYTRRHPPNRGASEINSENAGRSKREHPTVKSSIWLEGSPSDESASLEDKSPSKGHEAFDHDMSNAELTGSAPQGMEQTEPLSVDVVSQQDDQERTKIRPSSAGKLFALMLELPNPPAALTEVQDALRATGMSETRNGTFCLRDSAGEMAFQIADWMEPGNLCGDRAERKVTGLALFFQDSPGTDAEQRVDSMIGVGRELAKRLGGQLEDAEHHPLTAAREYEIRIRAIGDRAAGVRPSS